MVQLRTFRSLIVIIKRFNDMNVANFTCNPFQENGYILYDDTKECIVIDPGCYTPEEEKQYSAFIEDNNLKPVRLVNTHCHLDHICGNRYIATKYDLQLEAHSLETDLLDAAPQQGKMYGFPLTPSPDITHQLDDLKDLTFGSTKLQLLFTPGHSPGSISLYHAESNQVIAGDVLFHLGIGRTDLPGGDYDTLLQSIRTELFTLPDKTKVYSGHGPATTVGYEKINNPFFQ